MRLNKSHMRDRFEEFAEQMHQQREYMHAGRRGRLFEAGRMKLLVLHLIQQAPKHGYDIIKEISELVGDGYSPSPGTIYPTLTYLEDMRFVTVAQIESDRKQYHITDLGVQHLSKHAEKIQQLLEKLQLKREIQSNDQLLDIHRAMENLKASLRLKLKGNEFDTEQIRSIAEKIDQAAVEIGRL